MKVAILFVNIGTYHLERLISAALALREKGHQLTLIELTANTLSHPWQIKRESLFFHWITLFEAHNNYKKLITQLVFKIQECLSNLKADILVIPGYAEPAMIAALLWCLFHQKPVILLSESKEDDAPRNYWSETIKSLIVKNYKAALVGGKPHKRYLVKLGMEPASIFLGYDVVGNEAFHPDKLKCLPNPVDRPFFLSSNRFIPKKNLFFLLSSYAAYHQTAGSDAWNLVLCGDGSLRPQIEQHINELEIKDFVHLPGFLQQDELLPYFAHASCFIHASIQEQWGLVVNEAMAAGLPVLVSNRCGCFEDLIIEGVNGFGFDPENTQELTDLMVKMSLGAVDLQAMGHASLEHIQKFSPDYFAQNLIQAVEYALTHR